MTGIKFMDELTAPRRSTHPSHILPSRQAREESDITLAEYFAAMAIDAPRLELFTRVARDLEAWMEQSRNVYAQAEIEAAKMTPELFVEYCLAEEEGQTELLVRDLSLEREVLKLINYIAPTERHQDKRKRPGKVRLVQLEIAVGTKFEGDC
jgi:hypothetical protein